MDRQSERARVTDGSEHIRYNIAIIYPTGSAAPAPPSPAAASTPPETPVCPVTMRGVYQPTPEAHINTTVDTGHMPHAATSAVCGTIRSCGRRPDPRTHLHGHAGARPCGRGAHAYQTNVSLSTSEVSLLTSTGIRCTCCIHTPILSMLPRRGERGPSHSITSCRAPRSRSRPCARTARSHARRAPRLPPI